MTDVDSAAAHEAELAQAVTRREQAGGGGWEDVALALLIVAPLTAPLVMAVRFIRDLF